MSLYRSWMFVPGNQPRRLEKVKELEADVIIYDLEDSVSAAGKEEARNLVAEALNHNREKSNYVRINDVSTSWFVDDVFELAVDTVNGFMLPKAEKADQIQYLDHLLTELERKRNLDPGSIAIVPLIESAAGLFHAYEVAMASGRVQRLAFGSVDYALDINAELTREGKELLYARSQLVVVSRAAGIEPPVDAVYMHVKDQDGLKKEAEMVKQLGYEGKLCIHPAQLPVVNEMFAPTPEEIAEAREIVSAYEQAVASGKGAVEVHGKMVDLPVVEKAKKIMERAAKLGY
ncbi:MAG: CoA ester lyase [Bacillaceae bacterium]|nr:CoA ester lyase [Bacillaceae bacterium]